MSTDIKYSYWLIGLLLPTDKQPSLDIKTDSISGVIEALRGYLENFLSEISFWPKTLKSWKIANLEEIKKSLESNYKYILITVDYDLESRHPLEQKTAYLMLLRLAAKPK